MRGMKDVYLASQLICDTYAKQVQGASEQVQVWLIHKVKHTFQVAHEIMNILYHEKELYNTFSPADKELTEIAAVLHDLGRLYQHNKGQEILSSLEFEHGAAAVGLLKNNPKFNNPILLFAIAEHNHYAINYDNPYYADLSAADKKKAEIIAKLLRDADKLDNIRHTIYEGSPYLDNKYPDGALSEKVKEDLRNHRSVSIKEMHTAADRLAAYLGWINDIYFDYTKSVIKELGFVDCLIAQIQKVGAPEQDIVFLRKYLTI